MTPTPPNAASQLELSRLRIWAGIGVAGNFAGHLEQAGEAGDFAAVGAAEDAPKGIFPFYLPGHDSFLSAFPLSHEEIVPPPRGEAAADLQIEPEVALACEVEYAADGGVTALTPLSFGAFNDCSIRRPDAAKISEKKNWGAASKGVAAGFVALRGATLEEATADYRLACFLRRDGELHRYGVDSPLSGYSYRGKRLLTWIVERLANQSGEPSSPLEPVGRFLVECGRPANLLIAIGASRYTPFGESTFLRPGDDSIVVVYDSSSRSPAEIEAVLRAGKELRSDATISVLVQRVATAPLPKR